MEPGITRYASSLSTLIMGSPYKEKKNNSNFGACLHGLFFFFRLLCMALLPILSRCQKLHCFYIVLYLFNSIQVVSFLLNNSSPRGIARCSEIDLALSSVQCCRVLSPLTSLNHDGALFHMFSLTYHFCTSVKSLEIIGRSMVKTNGLYSSQKNNLLFPFWR